MNSNSDGHETQHANDDVLIMAGIADDFPDAKYQDGNTLEELNCPACDALKAVTLTQPDAP
jgi:hypothetical protein